MKSQQSLAQLEKEKRILEKKAAAIRAKIDKLEVKRGKFIIQLETITGEKYVDIKSTHLKRRKVKAQEKVKSGRSKRGSLKILLRKVFKKEGKPLRIDEILKGLKKVGYKTASKNPIRQLSNRLYADKNLRRPSPGTFELKA